MPLFTVRNNVQLRMKSLDDLWLTVNLFVKSDGILHPYICNSSVVDFGKTNLFCENFSPRKRCSQHVYLKERHVK